MKQIILLTMFFMKMAVLWAQVPSFSQIQVTSNIDSLQKTLITQRGIDRLTTLLSLEKSLLSWEFKINQDYLDEIKKELPSYPEAKSHYWYFNAYQQRFKTNLDKAFSYAKLAYEHYRRQRDSTGMVSALSNMGIMILERDEQNSPDKPQFGHQYLKEAMALSRYSTNPELQILYAYAFCRYLGWGSLKKNSDQVLAQITKGLTLINKHPQYVYYKIHLLNVLALLYESKERFKEAQVYTLAVINLITQHRRTIPIVHLYNLGFYYEMQQKYDKALQAYQLTMKMAHKQNPPSVRYLWYTSAGIHASLVGLKKYKEAAIWADSIYSYGEQFDVQNIKTKLQEAVVTYEVEKKDAQNKLLEQEKKLTETRSQLYLWLGLLTSVGLLVTGFSIYRQRLANKKLKNAFEEIVKLNQVRDYFFGVIAHDLRRPFASFQNMAELIRYYLSTNRYTDLEKVSQSIDETGKHISLLLDNLLSWALTQREETPYNPENVRLDEKIRHVKELYQRIAQYQQIQIITECPEKLMVYVDTNACDLIIRNIFDNALKNTQLGGKVALKAFAENEKKRVRLIIEDNGRGMSLEKVASIKNRLLHAELQSNSFRGLGLILVGRFIKSNRITIDLRSKPGEGTTFELMLPICGY
ncbi:tetratricopeptide repeat-containing sensor histidine kinase [Spirosoma foliorum]|uniref:histidine kinase n=1 Tax=Spirosoma foliorum TaxID=2710596 RepID=A0A7G5GZ67_9BACT|nr:tetratricopeptide repeat-containing sensor histidine kinase [Spirosoma foliorum]QMW04159.1 tetratricopeptide repeat-containing sensor histidine kinase [Spirosoma foliorum]